MTKPSGSAIVNQKTTLMEHPDLVNYIIEQLEAGVTEGDLLATLRDSEWDKETISGSMQVARSQRSAKRGLTAEMPQFDVRLKPQKQETFTNRIVNSVHDSLTEAPGILQSRSVNDVAGTTLTPDGKMTGEGNLVGGQAVAPIVKDGLTNGRKFLVFFLIALVLFIFIGGGAVLFYSIFNSHDRIARNVFESVAGMRSVTVRATIHPDIESDYILDGPGGKYRVTDTVVTLSGSTTVYDSQEPKSNLTATIDVTAVDTKSEESWNSYASMQIRSFLGELYVRPVENTTLPFDLPEKFASSWIKLDNKTGWTWLFDPTSLASGTAVVQNGVQQAELTPADIANYRNAIRRHPFFEIGKGGTKVESQGAKLHEYPVSINQGELIAYINEIRPLLLYKGMTDSMIDKVTEKISKARDIFASVTVDRSNLQVYGLTLTIVDQDEQSPRSPQLVVEFSEHDTPVTLEIPSDVVGAKAYLDELFSHRNSEIQQGGGARVISPTDTDGDGLSNADEALIYKTDPEKEDTDADGFSDGDEVENDYNPLGDGPLKK